MPSNLFFVTFKREFYCFIVFPGQTEYVQDLNITIKFKCNLNLS